MISSPTAPAAPLALPVGESLPGFSGACSAAAEAAADTERAAADFQTFYQRTARPLWAYLVAAGRDRALADDLLQESYLRLLQAKGAPQEEEGRRRYLFRIASHLLADTRRRDQRSVALSGDDALDPADPTDTASRGDAAAEISRAMATLPPRQRRLLWLAHIEGFDHREIAAALGLGAASVRVLLFRARRALAARLGAPPVPPTGTSRRIDG